MIALRGAGPEPPGDGSYLMERVPPLIDLWLEVQHPDLGSVEVQLEPFQPGESREHTVVFRGLLPDRGTIPFRVVDLASGLPLEGAHATVTYGKPGESSMSLYVADREGRFEVTPPLVDWEMQLNAKGFAPLRRQFEAAFRSAVPIVLPLEASDLAIEVELFPAGDFPREGVLVRLREARSGGAEVIARSDEAGIVRFVGLDPAA